VPASIFPRFLRARPWCRDPRQDITKRSARNVGRGSAAASIKPEPQRGVTHPQRLVEQGGGGGGRDGGAGDDDDGDDDDDDDGDGRSSLNRSVGSPTLKG
jgi:hypothetical protein